MNLFKLLTMDPSPERDELFEESGVKITNKKYINNINAKFKDETINKIRIKKSPHACDWGKSEEQITHEHCWFFDKHKILYFHTKVKGEIHSIGKGKAIIKKAQNKGFFDMILLIQGKIFVGLELKKGDGGYWEPEQVAMNKLVTNAGGFALVSNSVKITEEYLIKNKLI